MCNNNAVISIYRGEIKAQKVKNAKKMGLDYAMHLTPMCLVL